MSQDLVLYTVAIRDDMLGTYTKRLETFSSNEADVYAARMAELDVADCCNVFKLEETYRLISTVPHIVKVAK